MCLIHKKPVNAELFKGHDIILAAAVIEFVQFQLQLLLGFLKLLDGKALPATFLEFRDTVHQLVNFVLQHHCLTL